MPFAEEDVAQACRLTMGCLLDITFEQHLDHFKLQAVNDTRDAMLRLTPGLLLWLGPEGRIVLASDDAVSTLGKAFITRLRDQHYSEWFPADSGVSRSPAFSFLLATRHLLGTWCRT